MKVYVNYVKLKGNSDPDLSVSKSKSNAIAIKEGYEKMERRSPGTVTANKIRTIDF